MAGAQVPGAGADSLDMARDVVLRAMTRTRLLAFSAAVNVLLVVAVERAAA